MTENWWIRQLFESMIEASKRYENFQHALEPNVDDFDAAYNLHHDCCNAYSEFNEMTFETFIEIGTSLRARQAHLKGTVKNE